jgi:hypothetical protein
VLLTKYFKVLKSRRTRWVDHVARMGEGRGACRVLVRKPETREHSERLGVLEDNIKMGIKEMV